MEGIASFIHGRVCSDSKFPPSLGPAHGSLLFSHLTYPRSRRTTSYNTTAQAMATFCEWPDPCIGMETVALHCDRTDGAMPSTSCPRIRARGRVDKMGACHIGSASGVRSIATSVYPRLRNVTQACSAANGPMDVRFLIDCSIYAVINKLQL